MHLQPSMNRTLYRGDGWRRGFDSAVCLSRTGIFSPVLHPSGSDPSDKVFQPLANLLFPPRLFLTAGHRQSIKDAESFKSMRNTLHHRKRPENRQYRTLFEKATVSLSVTSSANGYRCGTYRLKTLPLIMMTIFNSYLPLCDYHRPARGILCNGMWSRAALIFVLTAPPE